MAQSATLAVDGEFAFTWADFRELAALVRAEAGIVLPDGKAPLVYSRLSRRLRMLDLFSFRDYRALIEQDAAERQALIAAMTTNVTSFFREAHHFSHLETQVLPGLIARARAGGKIRLWSAACSSGEEPWSIALTLLSAMPDAPRHDILILATDIDPDVLAAGRAARYPAARLADIPAPLRTQVKCGDTHFTIGETAHALVRFRPLNLVKPWPSFGPFDVIFCRNVMIYFDQDTQNGIWERFAERMPDGGHLYIGHSERIASPRFALAGQTCYRRSGP